MRVIRQVSAAAAFLAPTALPVADGDLVAPPVIPEGQATRADSSTIAVSPEELQSSVGLTIRLPVLSEENWSRTKERRFSELTTAKSLGQITSEQLEEWKDLRDLRRRKKNPLSIDEILFQHRRRELEARLLAQLTEYVEFLETPRRSKA